MIGNFVPIVRSLFARLNLPLVIGAPLAALMIALAVTGPYLAPRNPLERPPVYQDEAGEFHTPPLKPFELTAYPLGTDYVGRDFLSQLLWAIQPTVFMAIMVSLARMTIGTIFGFLEGWYGGRVGDIARIIIQGAGSMPLLIVAILVLLFLGSEHLGQGHWIFLAALSVNGWATAARLIAEQVRLVRSETYIEAARALGGADGHIFVRHVLPQLAVFLPVVVAFEMSATLLQMSELGFLGFYLGGSEMSSVPDALPGGIYVFPIAGQPELGQILSSGWRTFFMTPWQTVYSGGVFFAAIFGFMMLGEGLKRRYAQGLRPGAVRRLMQAIWQT